MKYLLRALTPISAFFILFPILIVVGCSGGSEDKGASVSSPADLGDDPAVTIVEILKQPDRFERVENLMAALRAVPAEDSSVFPRVLSSSKEPLREFERVMIVSAWSKHDPESALKWTMRKETQSLLRATMFAETAYAWALKDPSALRTDLNIGLMSAKGWEPTMLRGFVAGWYDSGEPGLETFIRDLGNNGDDRQRAISELIKRKLADETPEAMIEWAGNVEGGPKYRAYIHSRLAADIAGKDPEAALAWCDKLCGTELGKDMANWIATKWAKKEGLKAMNWISEQPDTIETNAGIRSTFRVFQGSSPEKASKWVEDLSIEQRQSEMFQGPIIMHVNRLSSLGSDELAIEWTEFYQNDWERERSLTMIARRWLRRDQAPAEAWLSETELLSDDAKAKLRREDRRLKAKTEKMKKEREAVPAWLKSELLD